MQKILRTLSAASLCFVIACNPHEDGADTLWSEFIATPDKDNLDTLVTHISSYVEKCDWGSEINNIAVPPNFRHALFGHINNGKIESLSLGLFIANCLDGGDLGDFKRSAARFFDIRPEMFVTLIKSKKIPMSLYTSILVMPPIEHTDNIEAKAKVISNRIELLRDIDSGQFAEIKSSGLDALVKEATSLQNIRSDR